MKKSFLTTMHALAALIILALLAACNARESTPPVSDSVDSTLKDDSKQAEIQPLLNLETLNVLWIEAIKFTDLKVKTSKKITFRFYVENSNALTMHGWLNEKGSGKFDTSKYQPDLELLPGKKSQVTISEKNYLGNLVIYNEEIKKLIPLINSTKLKYVLFIPVKPGPKFNQISYSLFLTNEVPNKDGDFIDPPYDTQLSTNPSPPRNSYN